MVRSPRSRGKGNRRFPRREGGARKRKPIGPWERRCQHLVDSPGHLPGPLTTLWYRGPRDTPLVARAYLFDQAMARLGVRYYATIRVAFYRRVFRVRVPQIQFSEVSAAIKRLEQQ